MDDQKHVHERLKPLPGLLRVLVDELLDKVQSLMEAMDSPQTGDQKHRQPNEDDLSQLRISADDLFGVGDRSLQYTVHDETPIHKAGDKERWM